MQACQLYQKLENQSVKCNACQWHCKIPNGKTGICGVRQNKDGELFLLVYGKPIAANLDPIEKKPLFHFLPGSDIFSIGTVGCNFACEFCQNWDISQALRDNPNPAANPNRHAKIDFGSDWPPDQIVEFCSDQQIPSIAFTYNEPTIFFEYAFDTMKLAEKKGIKSVFVSNGYESDEALGLLDGKLDGINVDLKSFSPQFYRKTCKSDLEKVLHTIERIAKSNIWLELTTLVIPNQNDSEDELKQIAEFISNLNPNIPWHVSAFHPDYKMTNAKSTPVKTLEAAFEIGKKAGLNFIYVGNVANTEHEKTNCPECKKTLVRRNYHRVLENNLSDGTCKFCGEKIPGVWN